MAKDVLSQSGESLMLTLGLNLDPLEMGFTEAGQTVKQAMARLNSDTKQIKIQTEIDVTKLTSAGQHIDALKAKEAGLNQELAKQQQKLELIKLAYQSSVKQFGANHGWTRGIKTQMLQAERAVESLKADVKSLNAELAKTSTANLTGGFSRFTAAAKSAKGGIDGLVTGFGKVNAAVAATVGAVAGLGGLYSMAQNAVESGEALYKLSQRLHTTTAEAANLKRIFDMSGTDINSVIPVFARLDKQLESAGEKGNTLTRSLQNYGIQLKDATGKLLPYNQQLEQLAKGYERALQAGNEESFIANVLGPRGASLVPLLEEYKTLAEVNRRVQTTGLSDPKAAHETYLEWKTLQAEAGQLTGALGNAMVPLIRELIPGVTDGLTTLVGVIRDNKDGIKEFGQVAGETLGGIIDMAAGLASVFGLLGDISKAIDDVTGASTDKKIVNKWADEHNMGAALRVPEFTMSRVPLVGDWINTGVNKLIVAAMDDANEARYREQIAQEANKGAGKPAEQKNYYNDFLKHGMEQYQQYQKMADTKMKLDKAMETSTSESLKRQLAEIKKTTQDAIEQGAKPEAEAWEEAAKKMEEAFKTASEEAAKANEELQESIERLTNSDLDNRLLDIDKAAQKMLARGADPELVNRKAELERGKATEDLEKETAQKLSGIYDTALNQRLRQIETERQAWIKKGQDEVQATRDAEAQKKQAYGDAVKEMFTQQKKYLDIYRKAMAGQTAGFGGDGFSMYDMNTSPEQRQQNAINAMRNAMLKDAGLSPGDVSTSLAEIQGFQQAMKQANDWSVFIKDFGGMGAGGFDVLNGGGQSQGFQMIDYQQMAGAMTQALQAQPPQVYSPNVNVNVDLGGAYVFDDEMKEELVNDVSAQVAEAVTATVEREMSGGGLNYAG